MKPIEGERQTVIKPRFELLPFSALQPTSGRTYLIKDLIPRVGLTIVWGPPKCGKSFWTFDALMHVALDWPYRDRRVTTGPVVYLALEGADGFRKRAEAFRQRKMSEEIEEVPFYLIAASIDLVADAPELIGAIRLSLQGQAPVAVAIDTLNRSLRGSESSDEDMAAYVKAADAIRDAFNCAVVIVHHCGHDDKRPRGHSSLTGAADAQLAVRKDGEGFSVTVEWMKDGAEGTVIGNKLETVEIGIDDDGDPITSCVVQSKDAAPSRPAHAARKLSDRQKLGLSALKRLTGLRGESLPLAFGLPASIAAIKLADWREELDRSGVIERDCANPRAEFKRLRESLQARNLVATRDDYAWSLS